MSPRYGRSENIVHKNASPFREASHARHSHRHFAGLCRRRRGSGLNPGGGGTGTDPADDQPSGETTEELVESPLFKKGGRFELSGVGEVCFDYGKRLLRLHDDMLDELAATIRTSRCGSACQANLPPFSRRGSMSCALSEVPTTFEVIVDSSQALSAAFRQNALDVAFIVGTGESEPSRIEQWRGQLRWFGKTFEDEQDDRPLPLVLPPQGWSFHEAAIGALRAQERSSRSSVRLRILRCWRPRRQPGLASRR